MVVAPMHVWELSLSPYMKLKVTLECSSVLKKRGGGSKEPRSMLTSQGFVKLLERDISANSTGLNLLLVQKIYYFVG